MYEVGKQHKIAVPLVTWGLQGTVSAALQMQQKQKLKLQHIDRQLQG